MQKLIYFFIIILLGSCTKGLMDPQNRTAISDANAFDTPERILAQVNGLYSSAKSGSFYGGRYIIYNELRADEFIINKPNSVTGQQTWGQSVSSSTSEVQSLWSAAYSTINKSNVFLAGLEENKDKLSDSLYRNYSSEAKFLRGLAYFSLVQTYAQPYISNNGASMGVVLRLNPEKSAASGELARSTVAEIYTQILSDLDAAEAGLPLAYVSSSLNATRAHKHSAIGLKLRVDLVMGNYAKAVAEGAKIVSDAAPFQSTTGVNNKLETSVATVFAGAYVGNEAVFSLPFTATDAPGTQNQLAYYFSPNPGNGEFFLNPAGTLSDPVFSAASTDARKGLLVVSGTNTWANKFKTVSPYTDYVPVIRYAEVMLGYAEALARTNELTKAVALLTAVRRRSNSTYTFPAASLATQSTLITTILQERKIELLGEGYRTTDLLRQLAPLPGKTGAAGVAPQVLPSESKYIWPISSAELSINKLCLPNP